MSRFVLTAQLQLQAPNNVAQVVNQIQSQLNGINVNLNVQGAARAQRQLQQVTAQTQAATTAADRMGRAFAVSIRRFAAFSIATRAVSLLTSTLADAIQTAIDFERQMIKISQVTGDSMEKLKGLTKTITGLSTGLGVSSQSLLEASTLLLQAGISAKDTEVALKTLAKAALAPNFDSLSETTEGAIAILAQFGQGVEALEKQLGSINAVAGAFAVEASDLMDVIRRTGGVFKASGGSLNELIALFTSVRATTRESAESIGTGLRTIFTRIQRPKTIEFLKQFGVELVDMEGKFVGPYEAIKRLSSALSGLGERDITFIRIAEELGGFRQIGKVLPLLQQFTVAQNALNVANKSGNSLTTDAATAQAALAIRIMKVKEEFLALIRGITETKTFQIMANTALSLASAFLKMAEAIKPLLPLLAAVMAFKVAKGFGSFLGGISRGMSSGRTYHSGGKVLHFARGGFVPGVGNRDTVPAMLSPGEFVIRKSSVNKLGAGNLAAMNENRYATGTSGRGIIGATKQLKSVEKRKGPYDPKTASPGSGQVKFNVNSGEIGAFVLQPAKGTEGAYNATKPYNFILPPSNKYAQLAAKQAGLTPDEIKGGINASINPASYPVLYPGMGEGRANLEKNAKYAQAVHKGFNDGIAVGVNSTIKSVASQGLLDIPPAINTNESVLSGVISKIQNDNQVRSSIEGYLFEGMISAFTGAQAAGGKANFDFSRSAISQNKDKLATLFGSKSMVDKLIKAEAKRSYGEVGGNIQRKLANDIVAGYKGGVSIQTSGKRTRGFASGGGAGTDTVPALLTPGEFVVNRKAAQHIGYGSLNRMNKVGKYAKGGVVQRFAGGSTGGVRPKPIVSDVAIPGFDVHAPTLLNKVIAKLTGTFTVMDASASSAGAAFDLLDRVAPRVAVALDRYNTITTVSEAEIEKLTVAYGRVAKQMLHQGYTNDQIERSMQTYADSLNARTAQLKSGASPAIAAAAAASVTPAATTKAQGSVSPKAGDVTVRSTGIMDQIAAEREKIEKEHIKKIKEAHDKAYQAIVRTHEEEIKDAKAAGASVDQIRAIFAESNASIRNLKARSNKQIEDVRANPAIQTEARQRFMDRPENIFTRAKLQASRGEGLSASTDLGRKAYAALTTEQLKQVNAIQQANAAKAAEAAASQRAASADSQEASASAQAANADMAQGKSGSAMGQMMGGFGMGLTMVTGALYSVLPPLEENSSTFTKVSHSILGFGTTLGGVIFALEAFGVSLNKQTLKNVGGGLMDFLGGKGGGIAKKAQVFTRAGFTQAGRGLMRADIPGMPTFSKGLQSLGGKLGGLSQSAGKLAGSFVTVLGPVIAVAGSAFLATKAFSAVIDSIYDFDGTLKKAIDKGNVEQAKAAAGAKADFEGANVVRAGGATAGAVIGMILGGPIGAAIGAGLGAAVGTLVANVLPTEWLDTLNIMFGGNTRASAVALAAVQAGAIKTQKELDRAQKVATNAMEDFEKGAISASDALAKVRAATAEAGAQQERVDKYTAENEKNKSQGGSAVMRNIGAYLGGGLFGMETASTRNKRITEENINAQREADKAQAQAFQIQSPARAAAIRSGFAKGRSKEEIRKEALGEGSLVRGQDLQKERRDAQHEAMKALRSGDSEKADYYLEKAKQFGEQIEQVNRELDNLEKEVARAKAAQEAMNLGLRTAQGTATAMSASMDHFSAGLEVGGSIFVANTQFLSEAMSSAAQAMDSAEIKSAMKNVRQNLESMGVSGEYAQKFEDNTTAFIQAQQNYTKAFEKIKARKGDTLDKMSAEDLKKEFADELTAGLGDDAKKNLTAIIEGMQLSGPELDEILGGNLQIFGDKLGEAGKKQFEEIMKIAQERQKAEQVLIGFIKQRAEAERNLAAAQKESVDLYMEGRDVQAKYGGKAVTVEEKRASVLAKANAGAANAGLGQMRTGSIADLRARNTQILAGFGQIESRRSVQGGMAGTEGVKADEKQKNLQQAQKDQIQTIRDLIKIEEEELKIIQEKNKMEKDSLEALIGGDVEKFFEGQAAMGAQAAIAAGDTNAANMFGSKAVGDAFKDIQRQQEAGVQTMFGRQLGGAGGLAEQAAGAALASRGVMDPRMAQRLAGTTAEEEASKQRLRDLGTALGETGAVGEAMAEMQVQTANINVANAEIKMSEIEERGRKAAEGMYRGGIVYANRGIFVPRGTDTVPAMLTPGEFVVRREAVTRDNNLEILQAINNGENIGGFARGGRVKYYNAGGPVQYKAFGDLVASASKAIGIDPQMITNLGNIFNTFVSGFNESIKNLQNTKLQVKLDSVNVNVNLNGTSMLTQITEETRNSIVTQVCEKLKSQYGVGSNGKLQENSSNLPRAGGP